MREAVHGPSRQLRTHALNGRFRGEGDVDRSSPLDNRDANDPSLPCDLVKFCGAKLKPGQVLALVVQPSASIERSHFGQARYLSNETCEQGGVVVPSPRQGKPQSHVQIDHWQDGNGCGDRQRAVPRTHPTPNPVDTRLRIVASLFPS